jgi:hypothetical protein
MVCCAIIYTSGAKVHLRCNYIEILSTVNSLQPARSDSTSVILGEYRMNS